MYCSSIFVFSLVIVVTFLSERVTGRSQLNSNYKAPQYKRQAGVLDIGNGNYKHNVIDFGPNPNSAGPTQYGGSQPEVLGNRFGNRPPTYNNNPTNSRTPRPNQYLGSTLNIGHGYDNRNTVSLNTDTRTLQTQNRPYDTRNNDGTSFLSESGLFNVGYGTNNHNQILVNGRPIQPTAPVNSGNRTPQTQNRAGNPYNNGGYGRRTSNNPVYVNGQPIQPVRNDGAWSTYQVNGETIHVLNTGNSQPINRGTQLKTLYAMVAQIEQIKAQLRQEAARLNMKL
ncbi:putative uncharacterized protein DDB_G0282499 isoform X2 [Maniola hyperantus]|uniref:putative uncharacterized protein DDB_G0282499 isoform X2 n=1 Tax=Aphantopus hyperantus TaxID=2795564 RepID=UPI0015680668|nr:uncharacterized protein LOC117983123 isoform X1 [Maniola hyperantus]